MDIAHQVVNSLNYIAVHTPWSAVAASGVLSPVLLGVKKWLSIQSEKVMITLVGLSCLIVAGVHYLTNVPTHDPTVIALQGFALAFMTQPFYFFMVKPAAKFIGEQFSKAAAFDAQVKSANQPVASEDFSQ